MTILIQASKIFDASLETKQTLVSDEQLLALISLAAEACVVAINRGGKVIFCGNGGSFADAQHLSAEFTSRFMFDRPAAPSLALGTNSSSMSAIGNDYGYDQFSLVNYRLLAHRWMCLFYNDKWE